MNTFLKLFLSISFLTFAVQGNAQLIDSLLKKKNKAKTEKSSEKKGASTIENEQVSENDVAVKKEEKGKVQTDSKKFSYRGFTLNTTLTRDEILEIVNKEALDTITEMQYYEQGEDLRLKDKNGTTLFMQFDDENLRLIAIHIESIENISLAQQLQQTTLSQMGEPTMGYEIMKNYDGTGNSVWSDYSTYEYLLRYIVGINVYDFQLTQFGAEYKSGKVVHPYSFSATINKKSEVAMNATNNIGESDADEGEKTKKKKPLSDDEKIRQNFYPPTGIKQLSEGSVEARMLRKW
ncbi:MAG: hypothetical protein LBR81_06600 [Prevotellaceae bacterium]|jgi:hypothetical protein|nr:hypothetical protein [Prevotellaceae bacterium]